MTDEQTTLSSRPPCASALGGACPLCLDEAHVGDIHGAFGTIRSTTRGPPLAGAARGCWRCWRSWARA